MLINDLLPIHGLNSFFDALDSIAPSNYNRTPVLLKEEENGAFYLTIDLPGVKKEDLQVEVSGKVVTIKAERKTKTSTSSYNRSFTLSEKYDSNTLTADLEDGVLTLSVSPKRLEESTARKVLINNK